MTEAVLMQDPNMQTLWLPTHSICTTCGVVTLHANVNVNVLLYENGTYEFKQEGSKIRFGFDGNEVVM